MNEQECLSKMVPPGQKRPNAYMGGIIQIWVTRSCDKSCFGCTQGSNLSGRTPPITLDQFEQACISLRDYFGVVGVFGGNPCTHPQFPGLCEILRKHIPYERRGLWSNRLFGHGKTCRETFNPRVSNLNVHLDEEAYREFKKDWPEAMVVGLASDSRHSPPYVAMKDVLKKECARCSGSGQEPFKTVRPGLRGYACIGCNGTGQVYDEETAYELISQCDINQKWSAMIAPFRGELRGYFCELAGAQAILHQHEPNYPDTGIPIPCNVCDGNGDIPITSGTHVDWEWCSKCNGKPWWDNDMFCFAEQVQQHCHSCGIPLRGKGELAMSLDDEAIEQCSQAHADVYKPKHKGRFVQVVTSLHELEPQSLRNVTQYLQNARK